MKFLPTKKAEGVEVECFTNGLELEIDTESEIYIYIFQGAIIGKKIAEPAGVFVGNNRRLKQGELADAPKPGEGGEPDGRHVGQKWVPHLKSLQGQHEATSAYAQIYAV